METLSRQCDVKKWRATNSRWSRWRDGRGGRETALRHLLRGQRLSAKLYLAVVAVNSKVSCFVAVNFNSSERINDAMSSKAPISVSASARV